jgi:Leucine-rich repeat (LRR) protein
VLVALQSLNLSGTEVTDLEPLRRLQALQLLDLAGTHLASLEPVYNLPDLHLEGDLAQDLLDQFVQHRKEKRLPY